VATLALRRAVRAGGLWLGALALGAACLILGPMGKAHAQGRVALVVGNSAYRHAEPLANPRNDAIAVAAAFGRLGFDVTQLVDADFDTMRRALRDFSRAVYDSEMAIVFFAGHGMEIAGENWLIPVDAVLRTDLNPEQEAIGLNSFAAAVSGASKLGLVILDACRDNPFAARMLRSTSKPGVVAGLMQVEPTGSVVVAYAARAGTFALDGDTSANSPYTTALLGQLEKPGQEVELLFRSVRDDVLAATRRAQEPFLYGALSKEPLYLRREGPAPIAVPTRPVAPEIIISAPNLPLPSETPVDPEILKLVETHPFFATDKAPPVRLVSSRVASASKSVVNRFNTTSTTDSLSSVGWLRRGIIRSETTQKIILRHATCPPGACVSTIRTVATLAGNGMISLAYRSTSSGSFGSTTSTSTLIRLDRMQGTIFPIAVGNRFSWRAVSRTRSGTEDEETTENSCEFTEKYDARRFHPKLTGDAILLVCRSRATFKINRSATGMRNSKELYFLDLGTYINADSVEPKERIIQSYFENQMVEDNVLKEFAIGPR